MFLWVFVKVVSCMHWHVSWLLCPHRPDAFAVGCVPSSPKAKESAESVGSVTGIRLQLLVEMFCDTKTIGTYLDLSARHNPQPISRHVWNPTISQASEVLCRLHFEYELKKVIPRCGNSCCSISYIPYIYIYTQFHNVHQRHPKVARFRKWLRATKNCISRDASNIIYNMFKINWAGFGSYTWTEPCLGDVQCSLETRRPGWTMSLSACFRRRTPATRPWPELVWKNDVSDSDDSSSLFFFE